MSEVDSRPAPTRGRSSTRGGRGGFGRGGPRGGRKPTNGTQCDPPAVEESWEDQGELGEMKKKFYPELSQLKELFPHWTDTDLVFALQESQGDVGATVEKITQGQVSQFAEVKKAKDRARSKVKEETSAAAGTTDKPTIPGRGGRGRGGSDSVRGGRGRGTDRGRGGHRGGRGGHATTNGAPKDAAATSIPTNESPAWDTTETVEATNGAWEQSSTDATKEAVPAAQVEASTSGTAEPVKRSLVQQGGPSWASMLRTKPPPAPVPVKQAAQPPPPVAETAPDPVPVEVIEVIKEPEPASEALHDVPADGHTVDDILVTEAEEAQLEPPKLPLTEENVEHLPDESHPPATQTVASTVGSLDPRNLTPVPNQQAPIGRPSLGGYATTASRLASASGRSASFQRRFLEQQEAVVMPGHNAVDRAAVQFGSMGLNGEPGLDVDDEREEPETRQPPQHSPPSQPRTSLPPAPRQNAAVYELGAADGLPTPKQAPGLPPASAQNQQQMQDPSSVHNQTQEQQMGQAYGQYGRFGQAGPHQDSAPQQQKPYDPFGPPTQHSQYEQYVGHNQQHPQQQPQSGFGGVPSTAPADYSTYYTHDQQSRNAYNQYYGNSYGQQDTRGQMAQSQHDPNAGQQRSASGFGTGHGDTAYASQQQQASSRYGETPGSGHNTPNPLMGSQQQSAPNAQQPQHSMPPGQQHQQSGYAGASSSFPYGHPYYNSPYQQAYQNQFGFSQPLGGYGGGYPAKQGNMYGQPHGYNMASQSSYDQHSASPVNSAAYNQNQPQTSMRSASGMGTSLGSGLDEYGRASTQTAAQQTGGFGGMTDPFARSTSGFGQGSYGQQPQPTQDDSLKPFSGDAKAGPTPQPGRPGSAANSTGGTAQSGLPPPPQSGFGGGYGGFPAQNSQYAGLGGLGQSHQQGQQQQQSSYSAYGGGFNQTYGGGYGNSRGGWGQNYNGGH